MKRLYLLIAAALLLLGVASSAGVWDIPSGTANAGVIISGTPAGEPPTACSNTGDIYTQSFEGAGYAANGDFGDEEETITNAWLDEDESTIFKCGSQSAHIYTTSGYDKAYFQVTPDGSYTEGYIRFYLYVDSENVADTESSYIMTASDGTDNFYVTLIDNAGTLQVKARYENASSSSSSVGATNLSLDAWHYIEVYFKDGAAGTGDFIFKVDGVEAYNNGTSSDDGLNGGLSAAGYFRIGQDFTGSSYADLYFDAVDIDSTGWLGE